MNDEQRDFARRLAAHPRFEWRDGMMVLCDGDVSGRVPSGGFKGPLMGADHHPDLTDAATGGVLWEMAGKPAIHVARPVGEPEEVRARPNSFPLNTWCAGLTLAEACARALLAEWGEVHNGQ